MHRLINIVQDQLDAASRFCGLAPARAESLQRVISHLAFEALDRAVERRYCGLARINASGLPFQWSFCLGEAEPSLRWLCECGVPGTPAEKRARLTIERLPAALTTLDIAPPAWLQGAVVAHILPRYGEWPAHWQSGVWLAFGITRCGSGAKVYLNLDRDTARERWLRVGWVLKALSRERSLQTLCSISGRVSEGWWPVGFCVDVLPNGAPGRVKVYFKSAEVDARDIVRWYDACHLSPLVGDLETLVESFELAWTDTFPAKTFFLSLELGASEEITLKTDMPVRCWIGDDRRIVAGVTRFAARIGLDSAPYLDWLEALGLWPPHQVEGSPLHQVVGFGVEADHSKHINIYCEPCPIGERKKPGEIL